MHFICAAEKKQQFVFIFSERKGELETDRQIWIDKIPPSFVLDQTMLNEKRPLKARQIPTKKLN